MTKSARCFHCRRTDCRCRVYRETLARCIGRPILGVAEPFIVSRRHPKGCHFPSNVVCTVAVVVPIGRLLAFGGVVVVNRPPIIVRDDLAGGVYLLAPVSCASCSIG